MLPEAEHLRRLGVANPFATLSAHPDCLVSTVYHVAMNRLREMARREQRHGSCGLGIGEVRSYWLRYGQDAVFAQDLKDRRTLSTKLTLLRDRFLLEMQELSRLDEDLATTLHETMPAREADMLLEASQQLRLCARMPDCRVAVFEGAQGVLLDEWKGFHPHTTWSTVTPYHALELIEEHGIRDTTILGITRAFSTRHGAGPFPTYCAEMTRQIIDPGNPANDWQGALRCGPLDLVLLEYAARVCRIDGLVVTSLDRLPETARICTQYRDAQHIDVPRCLQEQEKLTTMLQSAVPVIRETTVDGILDQLSPLAPVVITSDGPTHLDRHPCGEKAGRVQSGRNEICRPDDETYFRVPASGIPLLPPSSLETAHRTGLRIRRPLSSDE